MKARLNSDEPRQEKGLGQEQWGTVGLGPCPSSDVMWTFPYSFVQPICSRSLFQLLWIRRKCYKFFILDGLGSLPGTMAAHKLINAVKSKCSPEEAYGCLRELPNPLKEDDGTKYISWHWHLLEPWYPQMDKMTHSCMLARKSRSCITKWNRTLHSFTKCWMTYDLSVNNFEVLLYE